MVTMECVEKIIKKDMVDPTNSKKITEKDIIPLQRVITNIYYIMLSDLEFCCGHPLAEKLSE